MTAVVSIADRFRAALPPGETGDFDISGADRIGVPVVAADHVGPGLPQNGGMGYGHTSEVARTGALGELAEQMVMHEHLRRRTPRRASYAQLHRELGERGVVDPRALVLPAGTVVDDEQPRDWLPALRWRTGETVLVPAEFAATSGASLPGQDPAERLITIISNGNGAGDTAERAVAHGLLELLQRDGNGTEFRALDRGIVLDLDGVRDPVTLAVLDRMRQAGIEVLPKLASTQFGLADVHVVGIDNDPDVDALAVTACGEAVHPDREVALRKALLEYASARSRKVFTHAPLERTRRLAPESYWARVFSREVAPQEPRALAANRDWAGRSAAQLRALLEPSVLAKKSVTPFSTLPTVAPGTLDDPAALLAELLTRLAGFDVLVVLARAGDTADVGGPAEAESDVVVAKVIAPGLEVETMSYGRIGARGVQKLMGRGLDLVGLGAPPHEGARPVVLTAAGRSLLGDDAWLDRRAVDRLVDPLYPLYREPGRHIIARSTM